MLASQPFLWEDKRTRNTKGQAKSKSVDNLTEQMAIIGLNLGNDL